MRNRTFFSLPIVAGILLLGVGTAQAATRTWDGGGADNNWNTAANWSSNSIPGSGDTARFDSTSSKNCTINVSINVQGIDIRSTYAGTITQSAGSAVTVGSADFSQAGAAFIGGSSSIDCNDAFSLTGGTFTSTSGTLSISGNFTMSGGTFNHNSGTVLLDTSSSTTMNIGSRTLNHLQIQKSGSADVAVTGTADVNGNLTITTVDQINTGTIAVAGNVTTTDTAVAGSATILFDGTGAQTLGASGGTGQLPRVTINKSSGILTIQDTIQIKGNWTYTAGTVNAGSSTVEFLTNGLTVNSGSMSFNNVNIAVGSNNLTVTGTMDVNGNLTITSVNNINTGTIAVAGNLTSNDTSLGGTGTIKLDGTGTQNISAGSNGEFPAINIEKSAGTASLTSAVRFDQTLTITNGTLDMGTSNNLQVTGATTIASGGTFSNTGSGDLTLGGNVSNSGTVQFNAGGSGSSTDTILLRSTSGSNRTWSGSGTFSFVDVNVQRQTAGSPPGVISAISSTNSGNNVNWNFGDTNAVLYLKLDDGAGTTATDSSGNGFNGTLANGPSWNDEVAPIPSSNPYSISFDGADDSVNVSSASLLNPTLAFTISGWIYADAVAGGTILAKWNTTGNLRQYKLELSSGKLKLTASTNGQSSGERSVTSTGSISTGTWTHVAGVYEGDIMKVYIDAVSTSASFSVASAFTGTTSLRLGREEGGSYFDGLIDEVKLYNIALTDAEIAVLAQKDTTPPAKPINLTLAANSDQTAITATVTAPADTDVARLVWRYAAVDGNTTPTFPSTPTSGLSFGDGVTTGVTPSSTHQKTASSLAQFKTYGVAVWARDSAGNFSTTAAQASLFLSPPVPRLVITAVDGSTSAEAASSRSFVITAKDANNSTITSYAGPYSLTWTPTGGSAVTLVSSSSAGWANGQVAATVSIGGSNAGRGSFTAIDNSGNSLQAGSLSYTWYPASFTVAAAGGTLTAGKEFVLSVTAKDLNGTTVTRYSGEVDLTLTYENPSTGTKGLSQTKILPAAFSSGIGTVSLTYMDAGVIRIQAKDTTFVSGKTISGTSDSLTSLPASFSVEASGLPAKLTKVYMNQPFDVTVKAMAGDGVTVTPNYNGTVTLTGTGALMDTKTGTFVPTTDQGSHIFEDVSAASSGDLVMEASGGGVTGTSQPLGVREGVLVINTASPSPPGTIETTAFILDAETGELVAEDESTQFTLILGAPSAGSEAVSGAVDTPLTVSGGIAAVSVSKADTGEVEVSASVVGFPMRVTPATLQWVTGASRSGSGLNILQFEQEPGGRRGRSAAPKQRIREKKPPSFEGGVPASFKKEEEETPR
ncbi:MAG: hypothetical protein NC819_04415 [Candidatus Omnitrophica bacterium]|nr:hypothetical protein [Candidatus Omnitrophota bacterium]